MNRVISIVLVFVVASLATGAVPALAGGASAERGKALFNDPKLGTTGKSCHDCHPNGKGAEKAAGKQDVELENIINACVTHSIKGKALDAKSMEMQSLMLYIKSLGEKPAAPGKPPVGC